MEVHVLDAIMGEGKSTKLIDLISKSSSTEKFIYITPLLSECHRIAGTIPDKNNNPTLLDGESYLYKDDHPLSNRCFVLPTTKKGLTGTKSRDFLELVRYGNNIVSTHSLFNSLTSSIHHMIEQKGYTLVLDESINVYDIYDELSDIKELKAFIDNDIISIADDGMTLKWNHEKVEYKGIKRLKEIGVLCDLNRLLLIDGKVVMLEFPINIIKSFKKVYLASYLFKYSPMYAYLITHNVRINIHTFGKLPSEYKPHVNIIENKLNNVGDEYYSLSEKYYRSKTYNLIIAKELNNFFRYSCNSSANTRMWTVFKTYKNIIGGKQYNKQWVACSTKATNQYQYIENVAYLINIFPNPMMTKLLHYKNIQLDIEMYALCEMIQFIWRSRIRNLQSINLYIPSSRMRSLFLQWLNDEFV